MRRQDASPRIGPRLHAVAVIAAVVLLVMTCGTAAATELVPSLGLTRPVDGGQDAKLSTGLALRGELNPLMKGEIGVSYRSESRFDDQLKVRSWPVTASLWLTPLPVVYAGAGVGWYQTTLDYVNNTPLLQDETKQMFGVHVGGGLEVPVGAAAAVDLNGRYVMLRDQQSRLVPQTFNPDFWTMSLGLALRF